VIRGGDSQSGSKAAEMGSKLERHIGMKFAFRSADWYERDKHRGECVGSRTSFSSVWCVMYDVGR